MGAFNGPRRNARAAVDHRHARDACRVARRACGGRRRARGCRTCRQNFQWFGLGQAWANRSIFLIAAAVLALRCGRCAIIVAGRNSTPSGRTRRRRGSPGSSPSASSFGVFVVMGALVGLAALLNAVRFSRARQRRRRPRAESGRRGRRRRHGDHRWPWDLARHADRRAAARHDRHGADIRRHQSVLGKGDSRARSFSPRSSSDVALGRLERHGQSRSRSAPPPLKTEAPLARAAVPEQRVGAARRDRSSSASSSA